MRRVPVPLRYLLAVVLVFGTAWSLFDPPFQAPDETLHYAWTESLVERGAKPRAELPNAELSGEAQGLLAASNTLHLIYDVYARPPWSEKAEDRYEAIARDGARDNGGLRQYLSNNQPLYYVLQMVPYSLAGAVDGTTADRLFLMRWFSALWLLLTAVGGWLLAGEVFGRRRLVQLACAATVGLWPMITFITASQNPDGMLFALSTLALWLAVRIVRRGTTVRSAAALVVLVGVACVAKISGAALVPAAAFAILAGIPQVRARVGDSVLRLLGLGVAMAVAALVALLAGNALGVLPQQLVFISDDLPDVNGFASYLWQFYLPNPGFLETQRPFYPVISDLALYNTWFGMGWGVYGWVNVWFPKWIYLVYLAIALAVLGTAAVTAARSLQGRRAAGPADTGSAAVTITLVLAVVAVLAGVHLSDYRAMTTGAPPFAQARYLFPVAGVFALAVGGALLALPGRWRPAATAGWLGLLVVLQLAALSLVATRFYA